MTMLNTGSAQETIIEIIRGGAVASQSGPGGEFCGERGSTSRTTLSRDLDLSARSRRCPLTAALLYGVPADRANETGCRLTSSRTSIGSFA